MKRLIYLLFLLPGISVFIFFESCNKDESPVEPEPKQPASSSISVFIQEPSSEGCFVTIKRNISVSGSVISNNPVKEVKWESPSGSGIASGSPAWKTDSVTLQEGDNTIVVSAADVSGQTASDTIIITKNRFLTFLCQPRFNPTIIPQNQATQVTVQIEIAPAANLDLSSVKLVEVDKNNTIMNETAFLYDDGDLGHGDDIVGDNVFSNIIQINSTNAGIKNFRVVALTQETEGAVEGKSSVGHLNVFAPRDPAVYDEQLVIQNGAAQQLYDHVYKSKDLKAALDSTAAWLKKQNNVKSVAIEGDSRIWITYAAGHIGSVIVRQVDQNGKPVYVGGNRSRDTLNRNTPQLKLFQQTKGDFYPFKTTSADTNIILNKKVMIWGPCEDIFDPDVATELEKRLQKNKLGLKVDHFGVTNATIDKATLFCDYGMAIMLAHGASGYALETKEKVTPVKKTLYKNMLDANLIYEATSVDIGSIDLGLFSIPFLTYDAFGIFPAFIYNLYKKFPKSVIISLSCEGAIVSPALHTPYRSFYLAFLKQGASNYAGYTGLLTPSFANKTAPDFVERLVVEEKPTNEAYSFNYEDENKFVLHSLYNVRYTSGLINGDFEFPPVTAGQAAAWDVSGDARVIRKLGSKGTLEGNCMGIVSTGLGSATSTGEFSQAFRIKENESRLTINWRFFSEEFLEYIDTKYQDDFKIKITDIITGAEKILLELNIDKVASLFGASKDAAGSLEQVSPGIKFDHGDVYATPWQKSEFDISAYRGKLVRLSISTGDVGDSAYDTAVLLDDIFIE